MVNNYKPTLDDIEINPESSEAEIEMYKSEVQEIIRTWNTLSDEEKDKMQELVFVKSKK